MPAPDVNGGSFTLERYAHVRRRVLGDLPLHRDRSHSGSRSVVTRVEIGPLPPRDRPTSAPKSVVTRAEIGPVPQVCCVLMVPRCGMRLSPSSSSCVPRRRAGQAEPDRSRTGTGPISMRDVAGVPGGRRSSSMLHMGGWGLCRARLVLVGITEFSSDHRARRSCSHVHLGGLRTWEQDRARY